MFHLYIYHNFGIIYVYMKNYLFWTIINPYAGHLRVMGYQRIPRQKLFKFTYILLMTV